MLTEEAIAQININLDLCDTYLLNTSEINLLNASGADPISVCDLWDTTQTVLDARSKTDNTMAQSLEILIALSNLDSCGLVLEPAIVPAVNIPFFCGAIK